ncbi:MAG: efflux RND transporter periplasmic adaptor subunit [Bacteroidetes bacterium]|nr:efflux RND transporter periplasmic adaptor subunit [Bacteroidota bacterium]
MENSCKILLTGLLLIIIAGCRDNSPKNNDPVPVTVKTKIVREKQTPEIYNYSGNILPFKTIKFGFMVAGKIQKVYIVEDQFVEAGDPVADIDPQDYIFALDAAKAQYIEAEKEYSRLKALHSEASLTDSDFDKITALYHEALANYEYKKKQVNDTKLFAPASGWIAVEGIEPGEIVPQGMPLFGLIVTKDVFAEASVPENEINKIRMNMEVIVKVPALNDSVFSGRINRIGKVADPYSRSFPVKALIQNNNYTLKPGMIANIQIPSGETSMLITIPGYSILSDASGHTYVYVIKDGRAAQRYVRTGSVSENEVIIVDGIREGDELVIEGQNKLYEGASVKTSI